MDDDDVGDVSLNLVVQTNLDRPSHELHPIQLPNGGLRILRTVEPDQTESPLPSIASLGDLRAIDVATLTEMILEIPPTSLPGEISHEELTSLLGGLTVHETGVAMVVVVASMVPVMVTVPALFAILADEDGTSVELGVLEFADGAGGFLGFLVEDDSAAFRASVVSLEDIGLYR